MIPAPLKQNLLSYSEYKQQATLNMLLSLEIPSSKIDQTNQQLQHLIQCSFRDMVTNGDIGDLCSLLEVLLAAKESNEAIRGRLVLFLLESCVETVRAVQLERIVEVLAGRTGRFGALTHREVNQMHRIANQCLKRINNPILRGKLQCFLTFVLDFAHKSGLKQQNQPLPNSLVSQLPHFTEEQYQKSQVCREEWISYSMYLNYRHIYETLRNRSPFDSRSLWTLIIALNETKDKIKHVIDCFQNDQISLVQDNSDAVMLPIFQLMATNARKMEFRVVFMLQVLIYCKCFLDDIGNSNFVEQDRLAISKIVKNLRQEARAFLRGMFQKQKYKTTNVDELLQVLDLLFKNNQKWIEIKKGNIQNIVKHFPVLKNQKELKANTSINETQNQSGSSASQLQIFSNGPSSLIAQARSQLAEQIRVKVGIRGVEEMEAFLAVTMPSSPELMKVQLSTKPTTTSFSYYCSASGRSYRLKEQDEEDDRNLEWKAARTMLRERIGDVGLRVADQDIVDLEGPRKKLSQTYGIDRKTKRRLLFAGETDTE